MLFCDIKSCNINTSFLSIHLFWIFGSILWSVISFITLLLGIILYSLAYEKDHIIFFSNCSFLSVVVKESNLFVLWFYSLDVLQIYLLVLFTWATLAFHDHVICGLDFTFSFQFLCNESLFSLATFTISLLRQQILLYI